MSKNPGDETAKRVLIAAPTAKDAEITRALLTAAGLACVACPSLRSLANDIDAGAGAVLLTEEAISGVGIDDVLAALNKQSSWSDLPVVMMMQGGIQSPGATRVLHSLRNVTLLERPAPTRSVVSAMQSAVRARERQYQCRDQIETIQHGERRMSRIMESNVIGVIFCDNERILEANDAYLKIVGYSREDLEAGQLIWRRMTPPDFWYLDDRAVAEIAERGDCAPFEKEYIRKDGTRVPVLLTIAGLEENNVKYACFVQDLTGQKESEMDRSTLLESERAARSEAERAGRMKDEFLATLSHELRTPLNAILGWSQILRRRKRDDKELNEGLSVIERNVRAQAQLIEDLLDMSRIISGKIRIDVQQIDLAEITSAAIEAVRPAAEAKEINLHKTLDPNIGLIRGDPGRLQQVIWNLLSNAIKFTPRDGKVRVTLQRVNNHVEITVSDTGIGIRPEFLPYVFDRFRQADATTTRQHGGLGLGMAIVKNLVELHGGKVRAKSPGEGGGATFTIELPLTVVFAGEEKRVREHPRQSEPDRVPEVFCESDVLLGVSVLVVDDDEDARDLVCRVLEECKATVFTAGSVDEAIELLKRERPAVMVSDIGMPDEDGYDLIRRVRLLPDAEGGSTPAAALTAFARSEDRTRALRAGYQSHVAKPVEPTELVAVVASLASHIGPKKRLP